MLKRLVGHHWPEIGSTNTDIDHIADSLARVAFPCAAADPVGEVGHPIEDRVDLRYHVLTIDDDRSPSWSAERDVEGGPILRHVDFLSSKHLVDPPAQGGRFRQLHE